MTRPPTVEEAGEEARVVLLLKVRALPRPRCRDGTSGPKPSRLAGLINERFERRLYSFSLYPLLYIHFTIISNALQYMPSPPTGLARRVAAAFLLESRASDEV